MHIEDYRFKTYNFKFL